MAEPRGTVVGKLIYLITGDESALTTSMDKARKNVKAFGQELDRVGSRMSTMVTLPLVAAGVAALKFATQMEGSQETAQAFSKAMEDLKAAAASLVASFLPAIRGLLDWVSRTAQAISQWDEGTKRLVLTMAGLLAAIGPVMKIMGTLLTLISANPWALLAAAIVTVTVAISAWVIETNRAKNESANLAKQLKATTTLIDEQAIALNEERRARAEMLIRTLVPTVIARQQELDATQKQLQAERDLASKGGDAARARGGIVLQLARAEQVQRAALEEANRELKNNQEILAETERLSKSVADRKKEETAATQGTTAAIREKTLVQREEITAEEDAALTSRMLAEVALARSAAEAEARRQTEQNLAALRKSYESTAQQILGTVGPVFQSIGTAIVDSASGWDVFKQAAKGALAAAIEGLAQMWALQAAAAFVPNPLTFNPAAGTQLALLSAAALVASGVVRALASGGSFTTSGPQLLMVGDNPGGQEQVSVTPTSSPDIGGGAGEMIHVQVNLAERPILDVITRAARGRRLLIDGGAVV